MSRKLAGGVKLDKFSSLVQSEVNIDGFFQSYE